MNRHELVAITLKQLLEHFKNSPESFEYYDSNNRPINSSGFKYPCIFYQPKVQLGDLGSSVVDDPNNSHAIVVFFDEYEKRLSCYVFLKAPANLSSSSITSNADSVVSSRRRFEKWRGNYKKFIKLRNLIIDRDKRKERLIYLAKLSAVFPDTMDNHLFNHRDDE